VRIQPSSEPAGGTVVSWASLDHGGPVNMLLAQNMAAGWNQVPLFWNRYGNHWFFILNQDLPAVPPAENMPLGLKDAAMLAQLEASFPEMNEAVDTSAAQARNTPPPAPTDPDSRKFWRVHCDWSADTDMDGSPDWAEFEMAARTDGMSAVRSMSVASTSSPSAGGGAPSSDSFNGDTNHDGIPDGEQQDYDQDGVMDARDIAYQDATATFEIGPLPRYALFPISNAQPSGADRKTPLQISDKGTVLYRNGTWKAGKWTALNIPAGDLGTPGYGARAINDHDVILGILTLFVSDDIHQHEERGYHYWSSPTASPEFVTCGTGDDEMYAVVPNDDEFRTNLAPGPMLSNDGYFGAFTFARDPDHYQNIFRILRPSYWKLAGDGISATEAPSDHRLDYSQGLDLRWGSGCPLYDSDGGGIPLDEDYSQPSEIFFYAPDSIPAPNFSPLNAARMPSDRILALPDTRWIPQTAEGQVYFDGTWHASSTYAKAIDISADGTAIGRSHDGKTAPILLNGKWSAIKRTAPTDTDVSDPPPPWHDGSVSLLDTTPGGWLLAQRGFYPEENAVLLPIRAEGYYTNSDGVSTTAAVGVDDFSIGSETPGIEVQDRIWIMAPQGGFNKVVKFKAPLNSNTAINLTAPNILFGGQDSATLNTAVNPVVLHAADTVTSGGERLMTVTMGNGDNEISSVSKPIGLKIMKGRTVKVTVYKVTKMYGDHAEEEVDQFMMPSRQEIEDHLRDIFRPQINVIFNVNPVETLRARWDDDNDGLFDVQIPTSEVPGEEGTILAEIPASPAPYNIRVFLVANGAPLSSGIDAYGITDRENAICWVLGSKFGKNRNKPFLLDTIAHEIGHVLVGKGHPDSQSKPDQGPAPLPGTQHICRLMCSGPNANGSSRLLVKREWDEAEKWLKKQEDDGKL
jgi:hypothetical protein